MTMGNHDITNELKLPDNVQQNINEIMKIINQSINNFNETKSDNKNEINSNNCNNNETQDMYIEDGYLNDEIDFKPDPTDDIKIINVNNNWQINEELNDVEIIQVNPLHLHERLKRKLQQQQNETLSKS